MADHPEKMDVSVTIRLTETLDREGRGVAEFEGMDYTAWIRECVVSRIEAARKKHRALDFIFGQAEAKRHD